ncbi:MAG TPA: Gfo/Idh/MocA family oxidoreductase [Armatimonadota bacterium]|nr:Gfo/Idh/MocA family oxidoreductase [Armatimonadota bacterium]HOS43837.1 Gfo/Idh/MocA family oxidoreductase [Armatimonadota bacterium]
MTTQRPITVAIIGAGGRGRGFASLIQQAGYAGLGQVVGVAEPDDAYREQVREQCGLDAAMVFRSWQEFVAQPKRCDAVVISTMDRDHVGPTVACLEQGYHVLLEKPMATTLEDCRAIEAAQRRAGTVVAVCHSLRYHKKFARVKALIDAGRIGEIVTVDQLEQVAFWHQAHSFVRGNWGNAARSTFMLLAKSCHDIDYICDLVGRPCLRVSSFGSLRYFTAEHAPAGSTARCTDGCPVERECPYSAIRTYVEAERLDWWPACTVSAVHTKDAHLAAITTGPYGRCVFRCDNDVVDHQVVIMEFDGGVTTTFTMTAFTQGGDRKVRVHGTEGEIAMDAAAVTLRTFADTTVETIALGEEPGGHGGGDWRAVSAWLRAIVSGDRSLVLTDVQESLSSHAIVFAAERARREGRVVELAELAACP